MFDACDKFSHYKTGGWPIKGKPETQKLDSGIDTEAYVLHEMDSEYFFEVDASVLEQGYRYQEIIDEFEMESEVELKNLMSKLEFELKKLETVPEDNRSEGEAENQERKVELEGWIGSKKGTKTLNLDEAGYEELTAEVEKLAAVMKQEGGLVQAEANMDILNAETKSAVDNLEVKSWLEMEKLEAGEDSLDRSQDQKVAQEEKTAQLEDMLASEAGHRLVDVEHDQLTAEGKSRSKLVKECSVSFDEMITEIPYCIEHLETSPSCQPEACSIDQINKTLPEKSLTEKASETHSSISAVSRTPRKHKVRRGIPTTEAATQTPPGESVLEWEGDENSAQVSWQDTDEPMSGGTDSFTQLGGSRGSMEETGEVVLLPQTCEKRMMLDDVEEGRSQGDLEEETNGLEDAASEMEDMAYERHGTPSGSNGAPSELQAGPKALSHLDEGLHDMTDVQNEFVDMDSDRRTPPVIDALTSNSKNAPKDLQADLDRLENTVSKADGNMDAQTDLTAANSGLVSALAELKGAVKGLGVAMNDLKKAQSDLGDAPNDTDSSTTDLEDVSNKPTTTAPDNCVRRSFEEGISDLEKSLSSGPTTMPASSALRQVDVHTPSDMETCAPNDLLEDQCLIETEAAHGYISYLASHLQAVEEKLANGTGDDVIAVDYSKVPRSVPTGNGASCKQCADHIETERDVHDVSLEAADTLNQNRLDLIASEHAIEKPKLSADDLANQNVGIGEPANAMSLLPVEVELDNTGTEDGCSAGADERHRQSGIVLDSKAEEEMVANLITDVVSMVNLPGLWQKMCGVYVLLYNGGPDEWGCVVYVLL